MGSRRGSASSPAVGARESGLRSGGGARAVCRTGPGAIAAAWRLGSYASAPRSPQDWGFTPACKGAAGAPPTAAGRCGDLPAQEFALRDRGDRRRAPRSAVPGTTTMRCTFCNLEREHVFKGGPPEICICPVCVNSADSNARDVQHGEICLFCGRPERRSRFRFLRRVMVLVSDTRDARICSTCVRIARDHFRWRGFDDGALR
jgi:hypothetical protein